ncbi:MAG: hypothetical protein GH151_01205 [Bacteroidetes bacterium]|nr:hypothetical protein [Bacteroidota bacterium]
MPVWTHDKPTASGFYWYRYPDPDFITIIEVVFDPNSAYDNSGYAYLFGIEEYKGLYSLSGTFLGPIKVPKL